MNHPVEQIVQEVRVGWQNPSAKKKHILFILTPHSEGILWELRLSPLSEYLKDGSLRHIKAEDGKEHHESQMAKGCRNLTNAKLPHGYEQWIDEAFAYTCERYKID